MVNAVPTPRFCTQPFAPKTTGQLCQCNSRSEHDHALRLAHFDILSESWSHSSPVRAEGAISVDDVGWTIAEQNNSGERLDELHTPPFLEDRHMHYSETGLNIW